MTWNKSNCAQVEYPTLGQKLDIVTQEAFSNGKKETNYNCLICFVAVFFGVLWRIRQGRNLHSVGANYCGPNLHLCSSGYFLHFLLWLKSHYRHILRNLLRSNLLVLGLKRYVPFTWNQLVYCSCETL